MSYEFIPNARYRMPSHFGPMFGPRNVPPHVKLDHTKFPVSTVVTYRFLSERAALEAHLPPGFETIGDPVVSIDIAYVTQIPWLAGRGYNLALISWPATFRGTRDVETGRFAAVLFENFADPIVTGRDELGHPKIYCEIPPLITTANGCTARLAWDGYEFLRVSVTELSTAKPADLDSNFPTAGWLQWKYISGTPHAAGPDASYATHSPDPLAAEIHPNITIDSQRFGQGVLVRNHARWEDMPTVFNVANGIADLPHLATKLVAITQTHGWIGDVGDTRRLS
jgi:Acetoacetate decarboxylase (ADC)